ncbi:geranylgeranylglyceryl/heptaprenylglyceryl phosphate synthase [Mangrovimonas sp. AS39]|uniref:geranylgeranylglyceryl/heptaprenylglyceryl phosphate synthase n=1 Tax=Mangrovimonas futianensis TaxID=2895523 RepID=UPI001E602BB4|nr:geranylgeranylglyceryl/heptaprenylglyceryl phosphate synthase [Mangrovimonas futianensis]MCF1191128.1 geranylgeranylglyceryl/heptaprenylglyceryl phosphate synthase [Mangrovimonas futianensis]MCF1194823.1 geranylgeranylglyceryl/heptaprenylglyceryl phosphate synthase [Mangrovimonas futianensis]
MKSVYSHIKQSIDKGEKLLAVLMDPDKVKLETVPGFLKKVNASIIQYVFVGGSTVEADQTEKLVVVIKKHTNLPIVIFPGDVNQITSEADALLFLSLISGRNPDYLIEKHVQAIPVLKETQLEVIPTGYILIENGKETAVERVTGTKPISKTEVELIANTAKAGELMGKQLIYLEAGSGAQQPVANDVIEAVRMELKIPLIVGGGIRNMQQMELAYGAGADMIVIGTAFEEDESFFEELKLEPKLKHIS